MKRIIVLILMLICLSAPSSAEFAGSSAAFDPAFAQRALSIAELCSNPDLQKAMLKQQGYDMIGMYNYRRPDDDDSHVAAYTVFEKTEESGRKDVIISIRGTGDDEWKLNLDVMPSGRYDLDYAENFFLAAQDILDTHETYLDGLHDAAFLVTGFSRGAAVANVLGASLTDRFGDENVFVYTFATPRTVRGDFASYDNIFNVINPADIITYLPLPQWGFERYGTDIILPVDDAALDEAARAAHRSRTDKGGAYISQGENVAFIQDIIAT